MEGFYKLIFVVTDVFINFLVFSIIGPLGRKGFLKKKFIKRFSYSGALILVFKREYFLPR